MALLTFAAVETMDIVQLCSENAQLLALVADDVFDHPVDPTHLEAFLQCPRHIMVLAVDGGTVIGMASAVEYFHPDKPPQLWVNEVAVTPSRQNERIGRQLVQSLIDIGSARGCAYAWLGTARNNGPAQRCFASIPHGTPPSGFLLYEWDTSTDADRRANGESD